MQNVFHATIAIYITCPFELDIQACRVSMQYKTSLVREVTCNNISTFQHPTVILHN